MQVAGVTLVLRLGPETSHAATLVVSVELEIEAEKVLEAADEGRAGVGLLFHDVFFGRFRVLLCWSLPAQNGKGAQQTKDGEEGKSHRHAHKSRYERTGQ